MLQFIGTFLLVWFGYNLIFRLLVPGIRQYRNIKKQFQHMKSAAEDAMRQQQQNANGYSYAQQSYSSASDKNNFDKHTGAKGGEYIDFEEVK